MRSRSIHKYRRTAALTPYKTSWPSLPSDRQKPHQRISARSPSTRENSHERGPSARGIDLILEVKAGAVLPVRTAVDVDDERMPGRGAHA